MPPNAGPPPSRRRSVLYTLTGAFLAAGAPCGLFVLRRLLAGDWSLDAARLDVTRDFVTYVYVATSTTVAFASFGLFVGRSADRLRAFAATDPLTGLANRRTFQERIVSELRRWDRYRTTFSLLLIDVDRLKQINDEHGHEAGDAALRDVADALSTSCRATDLAARWGGDEFTVLAPGTSAQEALKLAARIREVLGQSQSGASPPTVSIGITDVTHVPKLTPEAVYANADAALYEAKSTGRDRAVAYTRSGAAA